MTVVELPEGKEGYAHIEVDGRLVALIWIHPNATEVLMSGKWIVKTDNNSFIYADAIRRK